MSFADLKTDRNTFCTFILIFLSFLLISLGYLSWLYHLMDILPSTVSADQVSEVYGYLFQAAGLALFAAGVRFLPRILNYIGFLIVNTLFIVFLIPSVVASDINTVIIFGYLMNLSCGLISGYYLYALSRSADRRCQASVFGLSYGASCISLWLLTLGGNLLHSEYALIFYAFLSIATIGLYKTIAPDAETCEDKEKKDAEDEEKAPEAETELSSFSPGLILLASVTILLLSLIKNLGFVFPSSDILAGVDLELSRIFYGGSLMIAGIVSDKSRKLGGILCLAALVIPFVTLLLSRGEVSGILLWSLTYFFNGFFSVYRVILFTDMSRSSGEHSDSADNVCRKLMWLAPCGLLFGRIGDAAGTFIHIMLVENVNVLVITAATLFILTVFLFFQLYQQLYMHTPVVVDPPAPPKSDQELFEEFSLKYHCSQRERDVLRCILKEQSSSEIAETLFITESTVKFHVHNLLKKTSCKNRIELIGLYHANKSQ